MTLLGKSHRSTPNVMGQSFTRGMYPIALVFTGLAFVLLGSLPEGDDALLIFGTEAELIDLYFVGRCCKKRRQIDLFYFKCAVAAVSLSVKCPRISSTDLDM